MIKNEQKFAEWLPAGFDGVFHWDFLLPAFEGTKIEPMDFDCVVEKNGKFLIFETKDEGKEIPDGQRYTFEHLLQASPPEMFYVIILRAKKPEKINGWEIWFKGKESGILRKDARDGGADELLNFTKRWFDWARGIAP